MAKPTRMKIGCSAGSTIQVFSGPTSSYDFIKPSVWAEMEFEDIPTVEEFKEQWDRLWNEHVGPQFEQMVHLMEQETTKRLQNWRDPKVEREVRRANPEYVEKYE